MFVTTVIAILAWQILRWRFGKAAPPAPPRLGAPWLVPVCACASAALFIAQLWTIAFVASHQTAPHCLAHLPISVVADLGPTIGGEAMPIPGAALMSLAIMQSLLLACVCLASERRKPGIWEWRVVSLAVFCSMIAALFAPAMTSTDPYLYFSYAKAGFGSFASAPHPAVIPDFPLTAWLCGPHLLSPSAYGPGFIAYVHALIGNVHDVTTAILMLRAANIAWVILAIALMRKMNVPAATLAIFALNPAVLNQYVTNAHNDLIPITLIVAAAALASVPFGIAAVAAAGLVKLPFLVVGAISFAYESSVLRRILAATTALSLGFGASYLLAGSTYFAGLAWYRHLLLLTGNPVQIVLTIAVVAFLAIAVLRNRYAGFGAFAFPGLAVLEIQPWYALWGLPYALLQRSYLAVFLAALPVCAFLMDDSVPPGLQKALFVVVLVLVAALIARDLATGSQKRKPA